MPDIIGDFINEYGLKLDEAQRRAAFAGDGHVLLSAVPGSGKTTVMVARLGYLVRVRAVPASSILAVTYSVAAAKEMKERYVSIFGDDGVEIRTIHGFCMTVINEYCRMKKTEPFRLMSDEESQKRVVRKLLTEHGGYPTDSDLNETVTKLTYCVNMILTDDEIRKNVTLDGRDFYEIFCAYRDFKREERLMDYDDMLLFAYTALRRYPAVLKACTSKYSHVCVDEAQDTSRLQHLIIRKAAESSGNLFMVGDEDQSIYGFRAAYPDGMNEFEKVFPDASAMFIERNYRSSGSIVAAADGFISSNTLRRPKKMFTDAPEGEPISVMKLGDLRLLPQRIVDIACTPEGKRTAVLSRLNDSLLPIADALETAGVRFTMRGRESVFFGSYVVSDVKTLVSFASDPYDGELFLRIFYKIFPGLSRSDAERAAEQHGSRTVLGYLSRSPELGSWRRERAERLDDAIRRAPRSDIFGMLMSLFYDAGYYDYVAERGADVSKLHAMLSIADRHRGAREFFDRLDGLEKIIKDGSAQNGIVLSTIHSAKGTEYDNVIIIDARDGILPSAANPGFTHGGDETALLEEERRLFYVGVTRARKKLTLVKCERIFGEPAAGYSFIDSLLEASNCRTPQAAEKADEHSLPELRVGTRVRYAGLGSGTVISSKPAFGDLLVTIRLDGGKTVTTAAGPLLKNGSLIPVGSARKEN